MLGCVLLQGDTRERAYPVSWLWEATTRTWPSLSYEGLHQEFSHAGSLILDLQPAEL